MPEGAPDPDLLEYAHENGYALLTHDQKITRSYRRTAQRRQRTRWRVHRWQASAGEHGIGTIVTSILEYHALIEAGAGTVQDDVDNHVKYI